MDAAWEMRLVIVAFEKIAEALARIAAASDRVANAKGSGSSK